MKTIKLQPDQKCVVISDVHIGNGTNKVRKILKIIKEYDFVVFNGDILELLIHSFARLIHGKASPLLSWMFQNPNKFIYVVGNHDEELWEREDDLFFPIYTSVKIKQNGNSFHIIHGHQFDENNRTTTWRTKILFWIEYTCNLIFRTNWQNLIFKEKKYFYRFAERQKQKALPKVRRNARQYALASGAKCLIHGHTHFANDEDINNVRVIDGGGFVIGNSYVKIINGKATLVKE